MSKAVKKVLTVAAAIAVAYFAPQVAATILTKAGSAAAASTAAKVVTTAAVNAAGNAAIAAATGGDVGKAAIVGALTGGISGYASAATAGVPSEAGGFFSPQGGGAALSQGTAAPTAATTAATAAPTAAAAGGAGGFFSPTGGGAALTSAGAAAPTASLGQRALAAVQEAGSQIVTKFTDPKAIADMTLRAAGQLAGSAIAGSGLSPAEQKLLAAQAADLQELKNTNQELYNLRLEQAKAILGEAARDYGFETESQARARGAGLTTAAVRGLTGERRRTELARQRRARAEEIATGRARGELISAQQTQAARQAGLTALPMGGPQASTMLARSGVMTDFAEAERRRKEAAEQAGEFFGSQSGYRKAGLFGSIV